MPPFKPHFPRKMKPFASLLGAAAVLGVVATAQEPVNPGPEYQVPRYFPSQVFQTWQTENPGSWILRERQETLTGRFFYGGKIAPEFTPTTDADFARLAMNGLESTSGMFRIDPGTLEVAEVKYLELSRGGGHDKVAVNYRQVHNGLPVVGASMHYLFHPDGNLVAIDNKALPGVQDLSTTPLVTAEKASRAANDYFVEQEDRAATLQERPELVIYPYAGGKLLQPRLAWSFELRTELAAETPSGLRVYVAADNGSLEILGADQLVHECGFGHNHDHSDESTAGPNDLQGYVESWATPGTLPDNAGNPEVLMPMRYMRVASSAGNTHTDVFGNFIIPYTGTTDVDLTFEYRGTYCRVYNQSGATYSYTQTYSPGVHADATLNTGMTQNDTAHANAYRCVNDFREWVKAIDPSDTHVDFQMTANVNISSDCNAYYNGSSINFYTSGGGCVNTAYSTVVAHEEGHWTNDLYNSGNGGDGFGEGAADVWAMYLYDTSEVGQDFCGPGCGIRTGTNTRQYCGDGNGGCYGQVHADGEVLMGALWKVRANLNTSLGNDAGDLLSDTLLLAWFNGYNDGQIQSVIEDHWLALDDDDGNVGNGTPNYQEINDGFLAQGFPGVDLDYIQISHTPQGDTQNESGYLLEADMTPMFGTAVTAATVHWSVDGGLEQSAPMSPGAGSTWIGGIPGQASPSMVTYWITAEDDLGNTDRFPKKTDVEFLVGLRRIIYFTDFETADDDGWTHVYGGGTSNDHDDWQHDRLYGNGGDPANAYSGTKVWGNDIGASGWNGLYQSNVNIRLISPTIDCTGHTDVRLRFARSLAVEEGIYDNAILRVAGTKIWENQSNGNHIDGGWTMVDYATPDADNNAAVIMRWDMKSDGGLEFGGWNVDDVMLYTLEPSGSTDTIALSGDELVSAGGVANYQISNGPADGDWYLAFSFNNIGMVQYGHDFDIGPGYALFGNGQLDENGAASTTANVPPAGAGLTVYVEAVGVDSEGALTDSNMLTVVVQ